MPKFIVVSRAQSGVRLGRNDPLIVEKFPTLHGPVDIAFATRLTSMPGFSNPVPMGLMSEVRGSAPSLNDAVQEFSRAAQSLCPVLVFIGNSPIEDMTPEIGYDISDDTIEHDYFQHFLAEERVLMIERRRISSDVARRVLLALFAHPEVERLRRALGQYYQALRNWQPGQEILALAHLWMSVEALTPVVSRRLVVANGGDRASLIAAWGVEERAFDSEVRKREIFRGDSEAYRKAKLASDGFEHGFLSFPDVHAHSIATRQQVANYLRTSILNELSLDISDMALLQQAPFDQPGHIHGAKYLRGKLIGKGTNLAAPDQNYPFLKWKTTYTEGPESTPNEVKIKINESMTGHFAKGVTFRITGIEVWGGQKLGLNKNPNPIVTKESAKSTTPPAVHVGKFSVSIRTLIATAFIMTIGVTLVVYLYR